MNERAVNGFPEFRLRVIADSIATVGKCWPAGEFYDGAPVGEMPWLTGFFAEEPLVWELPWAGSFWNHCLVADWSGSSQYDLLRRLGPDQSRACGNLACLALTGEGFHGQHGRPWQTLAGNLHLSLKVDLDLPAPECSQPLVMLPAVVVMDVLGQVGTGQGKAGVKWVNDVLVDGRKLAGVLSASRSVAGRLVSAVFGLGFNLQAAPGPEATSLADHLAGPLPTLGSMLELFLQAAESRITEFTVEGPGPIIESYQRQSLIP